jgi:hypothetical protein
MFYMIQILIQFMTLAHVFGQVMTVRSLWSLWDVF